MFKSNTLGMLIIALSAMPFLTGCSQKSEADPRTEPPVVPVFNVGSTADGSQSFTGTVGARVVSNLGFRVPGKITERLVDTGDTVKKGQPLYKVDRTDFAHAVQAREGSVASKAGDVAARSGDVAAKQSAVEAARARLVQAEADEKRYKGAVAVGVVTEQAYDQYKAAADTARAELKAAESEVVAARAQVAAAQSEVRSLKEQQKVAENEGSYSVLNADSAGIVVETIAEPGQVVQAGQTIVKLALNGPREAVVNLPETVRPALGSVANAEIYGSSHSVHPARLRQLSDSADTSTRTYEARYVLQGDAASSPLGATVNISLPTSHKAEAVVPLSAIVDRGDGPAVWTLDSHNTVHLNPIKIKTMEEEHALLASGLKQGQKIVAVGAQLLHEGDTVRIGKYEDLPQ